MSRFAYYLSFRTPLHIGERGIGQEETREFAPADTLFSALCTMWRMVYGVDSLRNDLLERYRNEGREPFWITSAFPFAGEVRLYPKPLRPPQADLETTKRWKSIRWVSEGVLEQYCAGRAITLEATFDARTGTRRVLLQQGTVLITIEEYNALARFWDFEQDDLAIYREAVVPRVTLDRITNASQIWQFGEVHFTEGCGLWFGVEFADGSVQSQFEACLRLLGDSGLGGERGGGRGLFTLERREWRLAEPSDANAFLTLSPWLPVDDKHRNWLRSNGSVYELVLATCGVKRYGWLPKAPSSPTHLNSDWGS
jgi:CRISPR-associated protein Csm4